MCWIEGIKRMPQGFVLSTYYKTGSNALEPLARIGSKVALSKTSRARITSDCQTWQTTSASPFWKALDFENHQPQDRHQVFELTDNGRRYLVPASVLITALIRPIKDIHAFLFSPHGLEHASFPIIDAPCPQVGFYLSSAHVIGNRRHSAAGLLASHSWLHCFPSARAMWDSVYQHAQDGRLDIALPKATLTAVLHSVPWEGKRLVTSMVITNLHADEAPYEFAANHPRHITFHESPQNKAREQHQASPVLPNRDGSWQLSNDEWQELLPLAKSRHSNQFCLRHIIDLILVKLGTGTSWQKQDYQGLNRPIVVATYQRMQRDGRWQTIEETLRASRRT